MRLLFISALFFVLTCCNEKSKPVIEKKFSKEEEATGIDSKNSESPKIIDWNELTGVDGVSLEESTDRSTVLFDSKPFSGRMKKYTKSGIVETTGEYLNGKLSGKWVFFHSNGNKWMEGVYSNDLRVGEWNYYDESGSLEKILTYDDGNYISTREV